MNRKKEISTSQLLIHDSMSMSVKRRNHPAFLMIMHPLISLGGILSVVFSMQGFFGFPIDISVLLPIVAAVVFGLFLIRSASKKAGFAVVILILLTVPLLLVTHREHAIVGAQNIYELMHASIFHEEWKLDGRFISDGVQYKWTPAQVQESLRMLYDIVLVMLTALMEYTDVLLTQGHSGKIAVAIRLLITFPFLESGLYFGLETSSAAVFLMILFWVASIALVRPRLPKQTGSIQKSTDKLQRDFLHSADKQFLPHECTAGILVILSCFVAFGAVAGAAHYSRTDAINQKRAEILDQYRNFSIRDATGLLSKIPSSLGINVISDELDLTKRGDLNFDGRTVMKVNVGGAAVKDDYYMRGIVRSEYTGNGWAVPTSTYRSHMQLFQDLTDISRVPQTVFHSDHVDRFRTRDGKYPVVRCDVEALNAESINYLPYQSIFDSGTKYRYDAEVELGDHQKYSFWLLTNADVDWSLIRSASAPSANPKVHEYEEFVRNTYLDVPDTPEMEHLRKDFCDSTEFHGAMDTLIEDGMQYAFMKAIRSYIWNRAEYTISPGPTPKDADFVDYFLFQNHKGFCAHYASAAVLLCRMNGIPARYVQGYVMTKGNFADAEIRNVQNKTPEADYLLEIADEQAHAWVEVYINGFGWIPFEFTESVLEQWHTASVSPSAAKVTSTTTTTAQTGLTTTTTTTTQVTTAAGNGGTPGGNLPLEHRGTVILKSVLQILMIVMLAVGAVLAWRAWHRKVTEQRAKEMHGKNPNRSAEASYQFFLRLMQIMKIRQNSSTHEAFAVRAETDCRLLEAGAASEIIRIMQTVAFSQSGIEEQDAAYMADTISTLADRIYREANPFRRIWMKWFLHIV